MQSSIASKLQQCPHASLFLQLCPLLHCRYLVTASQVLAPLVDASGDTAAGYSWCCQAVEKAGFLHAATLLAEARPSVLLHWGQHAAAVQAAQVRQRRHQCLTYILCPSIVRLHIVCAASLKQLRHMKQTAAERY